MVRHNGDNFVNIKGITVASMLSLQSEGINGSALDAPKPDDLPTDSYTSLGQKIVDVAMAEIESVIDADRKGDDVGYESVAFTRIHWPMLAIVCS